MSLPKVDLKIQKIRELPDAEISSEILAVKRELFELRLKQATRQPFKPSDFGLAKHRLSQLLTIENQRKKAVNGGQN